MALLLGGSSNLYSAWTPGNNAPMTLMAWGRRSIATDIRALVSAGNQGQSTAFNTIESQGWTSPRADLAVSFLGSPSYAESLTGDLSPPDTTNYHHFVGVFSAGSPGSVRFYRDGTAYTAASWTPGTSPLTTRISIGRQSSVDIDEFWQGGLCHVAVWNIALTAGQIADLYNLTTNPLDVAPSNLVCYLPLTDALTDSVGDLTWTAVNLASPTYESSGITYPASGPVDVDATVDLVGTTGVMAGTMGFTESSKPETTPIALVATGTVATAASATTLAVTSPAGSIGDLLIFFLNSNDYSDGTLGPLTPPITLTQINPGSDTQLGGDFRARIYWGIEDQAAERAFNFGTLTAVEEVKGVCLRFSGADPTNPILSGTPARLAGLACPPLAGTKYGQWAVMAGIHPLNTGAGVAPTGWTERVDSPTANYTIYVATKALDNYPLTVETPAPSFTSTTIGGLTLGFVIDLPATDYQVAGVTRDAAGTPVGSVQVSLFKHMGSGVFQYVGTQVSNATTGAYSFTVYEHPSSFMVYAHLSGSPDTFDCSDWDLLPI